jgi:hypothetical protein
MGLPTTCYGINLEQFKKPVYWTLVQYEDGRRGSSGVRFRVSGKDFLILTPEH